MGRNLGSNREVTSTSISCSDKEKKYKGSKKKIIGKREQWEKKKREEPKSKRK